MQAARGLFSGLTCDRMGIETVAVFSEPDRYAKHVERATESYCVGPAESSKSYLRIDKIIEACKATGAEAVHPGYGFLSENKDFCDMLEKEGIVFIGPKVQAILSMGLKIESKEIAKSAGVNTIPGVLDPVKNEDECIAVSNEIGYPVMIKASAGGGGKGMRIAWNDNEAAEGFRMSRDEARNSFSNDTIFVEKFIEEPRHIEIQLLCDAHGNGVYLNERECSIQRRNQKVLEEAPSTFIDAATRKAMGEQALALAAAVDYQSAGTVEFLVDKHRNFYFLEMNTRLQVEHPVSEYITGVDIVEHMIRVAAGEKLAFKQDDIGLNGWSLEARVYAEDPYRNFLPCIGRLSKYKEPATEDDQDIRCESGLLESSEISMYYDPLICKLVTYGSTREAALEKMRTALDSYVIRGVTHNVPFLRALCDHPRFISGDITTKFIEEEYPEGFETPQLEAEDLINLASIAHAVHGKRLDRDISVDGQTRSFSRFQHKGLQLSANIIEIPSQNATFVVGLDDMDPSDPKQTMSVAIARVPEVTEHAVDNADFQLVKTSSESIYGQPLMKVSVNDTVFPIQVLNAGAFSYDIQYKGLTHTVNVSNNVIRELNKFMPEKHVMDASKGVISPMPGAVVSVAVAPGDQVVAGQEVCVIEAMKMQNTIHAETDAVVKSVLVKVGDTVATDEVIVEYE